MCKWKGGQAGVDKGKGVRPAASADSQGCQKRLSTSRHEVSPPGCAPWPVPVVCQYPIFPCVEPTWMCTMLRRLPTEEDVANAARQAPSSDNTVFTTQWY